MHVDLERQINSYYTQRVIMLQQISPFYDLALSPPFRTDAMTCPDCVLGDKGRVTFRAQRDEHISLR